MNIDYQFFGGLINEHQETEVEVYKRYKKYDDIFLFKKFNNFSNMKTKGTKSEELVKVPESALLSLVASKLKDRVLFPKKVEDAKKFLQNVKKANS